MMEMIVNGIPSKKAPTLTFQGARGRCLWCSNKSKTDEDLLAPMWGAAVFPPPAEALIWTVAAEEFLPPSFQNPRFLSFAAALSWMLGVSAGKIFALLLFLVFARRAFSKEGAGIGSLDGASPVGSVSADWVRHTTSRPSVAGASDDAREEVGEWGLGIDLSLNWSSLQLNEKSTQIVCLNASKILFK